MREEDIDSAWLEKEKTIESASEDLAGKPDHIIEKIVTGRIEKLVKTKLLMTQPYIRGERHPASPPEWVVEEPLAALTLSPRLQKHPCSQTPT